MNTIYIFIQMAETTNRWKVYTEKNEHFFSFSTKNSLVFLRTQETFSFLFENLIWPYYDQKKRKWKTREWINCELWIEFLIIMLMKNGNGLVGKK